MKFSVKIFLGIFLVLGLGGYLFFSSFMQEIKPGFRQSSEESLVDLANLIAELVAHEVADDSIANGDFAQAVKSFQNRKFNARIWSITKRQTQLQFYITDTSGIVLYDSSGKNTGADYSRWNDVYLSLRGDYGVRSTLSDPDNKLSSVMHVAAPIKYQGKIIGVVSVQKPNLSMQPFFEAAQRNLIKKGGLLLFFSLAAGLLISIWLSRSIRKLAGYANAVRAGKDVIPPEIYGTELQQLAAAMEAMKEKLEGKNYVEHYVHTLTHQLKTPIASIQGAAELLTENMDTQQQQRFIANIRRETNKLQLIVQNMLDLAAIENRKSLETVDSLPLKSLLDEIIQSQQITLKQKSIAIDLNINTGLTVPGDRFLLLQAITNLLDNAIAFSPENSTISIWTESFPDRISFVIADEGSGIPGFAIHRLFERFYSLPKPGSRQKSSGLGLCFAREIARLHGGDIQLYNRKPQGVIAKFYLPSH